MPGLHGGGVPGGVCRGGGIGASRRIARFGEGLRTGGERVQDVSELYFDPYDLEHQRRPVPGLPAAARRSAALLQRAVRLLRAEPLRRRRAGLSRPAHVQLGARHHARAHQGRTSSMPPGMFIFEDPPMHDIHRGLLSRVFTPRRVAALEPKIRALLRPEPSTRSSGRGGFDFVTTSAPQMPMRVDRHAARHPRGRPGGDPRPRRRRLRIEGEHRRRRGSRRASSSSGRRSSPSTSTGGPSTPPTT